MAHQIITIRHEYGRGWRIIWELVAKKMGFDFYNRHLIDFIALESGLDINYIEHFEKRVSRERCRV